MHSIQDSILISFSRFRWVVCQLDILQNCSQPSKIRKALKSLPKTLDATYDRMLLNIDQEIQGQAFLALKWLAFSARPLDITELAEAVVVNPRENPRFDPDDRLFSPSELLRFLSGLVTISSSKGPGDDRSEIRLAHFSVKEYLISERIKAGPASRYSIREIPANISIAETCIAYLLQFDSPNSLTPQTFKEFPLVKYASRYWTQHAQVAERNAGTLHLLIMELFLSKEDAYVNWVRLFDPEKPQQEPVIRERLSENLKSIPSPLHYASAVGLVESVKILLKKGAEIDAKDNNGETALYRAASKRHEAVVKLLLENGAEFNVKGSDGKTTLYWAAYHGHEAVVKLLLGKGAKVDAKDVYGNTALYCAAFKGHEAVVKLLVEKGAGVDTEVNNGGTALHGAASNGHIVVTKLLLEKKAEVNAKESNGDTALHLTAYYGHEAVVELLLEKGAEVDAKGSYGKTALYWAAHNGHKEVVKLLLEKGANAKTSNGTMALHRAANYGHQAVVQLLLEKGANVDMRGGDGKTALYWAACYGQEAVVKLLLEKGAKVNAKDSNGETALFTPGSLLRTQCRSQTAAQERG
jgi:ankyrin repeat protein